MAFDIIGDIHGCHRSLTALLEKLGYRNDGGVYRHPERRVIFLGDFIDRGPGQREVLEIVWPMVDNAAALAVMGNHEFNAIGWATPDPEHPGSWLRPHIDKNRRQHQAFLDAFADDAATHRMWIDWFLELPLWLELDGLRIVHACWDPVAQSRLRPHLREGARLDPDSLSPLFQRGSPLFDAAEVLLKGWEIPLPDGVRFLDKDRNPRHAIRIRWWDSEATTYRQAYFGPEEALTHIPDDPIVGDHLIDYGKDAPPVCVGHYWLSGEPTRLAPNIACLDWSVAKKEGRLAAYRWDGEQHFDDSKFVWIYRQEQ